jgi:8-oxo-dGTP pyrophosphatase MutT (NUDIX family)
MSGKHMFQIGALCWRLKRQGPEILLVTSRETKRWVIPKGWPMPHLVHSNAAKQEAFEEAGILGRVQRKPLGTYSYDKIQPDGSAQACKVLVFALKFESKAERWPERKERKREWFAAAEAAAKVHEPGLKTVIRLFAAQFSGESGSR